MQLSDQRVHHKLVRVEAAPSRRWAVSIAHRPQAEFFGDRELALTYAQILASVNRPCAVQVYGTSGTLEHEWMFG